MKDVSKESMQDSEAEFYKPEGTRRRFFGWLIAASSAFIGICLALPLTAYVISPALKRRERTWVDLGKVEDIPLDIPTEIEGLMPIKDGWKETKTTKIVWTVKRSTEQVTVFSPICPHLGCGYRWSAEESQFKCPCHGSIFDRQGAVLAGPAPRPLDVLPSKIENGRLFVMYKQFRSGLTKSVEL